MLIQQIFRAINALLTEKNVKTVYTKYSRDCYTVINFACEYF